ncbi:MAG: diacylglycerol kinase, partial [Candidatus Omnitrophica bacterium]|nr:diacylglycerol kinase [Candidatus Omnitrophota bacterium]
MSPRKLVKSLNSAAGGLIYVLRTQRNMRLHFLFALLVLVLGAYL